MKKADYFLLSALFLLLPAGCDSRDDLSVNREYRLDFSSDTVRFDTLFSTVSSATASFMVYNNSNLNCRSLEVSLAGGDSSPFRINVDGEGGTTVSGLEIEAGDSLFCFVTVNIPDDGQTVPFMVADSVIFRFESGGLQYVQLRACGRNALFLHGRRITSDETFNSDLPYLIYDSLYIAPGVTLTITPGTELYFHQGAGLVVEGRVLAEGTSDSMIVMRGDRLDRLFEDLPYDLLSNQWAGIRLGSGSFGNLFSYCDIHGGEYGIVADSSGVDSLKFGMASSIVHNVSGNGIHTVGSRITVANSQITNAGGHCVEIVGGSAEFNFCTIAGFPLWWAGGAPVSLSNSLDGSFSPLIKADFRNCIITGYHKESITGILHDSIPGFPAGTVSSYSVSHSLLMTSDTLNSRFEKVVFEQIGDEGSGLANFHNNGLVDSYRSVFRLDSLSKARGIADTLSAKLWPADLAGVRRPLHGADAGCFQFEPSN
ncbi:MAG: right-handed parallel beta-helix repeat-containing protein [Bacteroidaceae bacterium]